MACMSAKLAEWRERKCEGFSQLHELSLLLRVFRIIWTNVNAKHNGS